MPLRIVLLTPRRRFIGNQFGLGYQIPLGSVMVGGPLADAGHTVKLIDNDLYGWDHQRLIEEIRAFGADCLMMGHTGSTAAHPICLETARVIRAEIPDLKIAYGGVYPSYASHATLRDCPGIDVVLRGEAEETAVEVARAWEADESLEGIAGLTWRDGERIMENSQRVPIRDLDQYRPGWELVDWPGYELFTMGTSAGMQFSRGCPLTCTYCGQWLFWKKWRHRSPANLVSELTTLARDYGVKIVWMADENFSADREVTNDVLQRLIDADLGLSININMTAADVVRDADLLPLYKAAGIDYVVMGVESLDDRIVEAVRKNNPYAISKQAVRLLRKNKIIALVDIIYGLEDESARTMIQKFGKIVELDADILNAVYLTPHFWTAAGRQTDPRDVIQTDQSNWTYRNQIIATPHLKPLALFLGVKLTEALFHLRPAGLIRLIRGGDWRLRRILRSSYLVGMGVLLGELIEFVFSTAFAPKGTLDYLPGDQKQVTRAVPAGR